MDIRAGRAIDLDKESTPNERISQLVRTLFKGKQREAAREFGISQAVLSKIVRNEQVAGQRVLAAIALHPRINAQWLYTGEGSSLVPGEGEVLTPLNSDPRLGEVGPTLPIAGQFLPGPPTEFPLLLTRKRMPVASPDYATTRYFLELTGNAPILRAKGEKVAPGDCLLMEANRSLWIDRPLTLNGRLMIVSLGAGHGPDLVLARGGSQAEGGYLPLDTFGVSKRIVKLSLKTSAQGWSSTYPGRQGRAVELENNPDEFKAKSAADRPTPQSSPVEAPSRPRPPAGAPESRPSRTSRKAGVIVYLDDVVSICVMLIRA